MKDGLRSTGLQVWGLTKPHGNAYLKQNKTKQSKTKQSKTASCQPGAVAQLVTWLPSMHETLGSMPRNT